MIAESNSIRLKITDIQGDSLIVHDVDPDGEVIITCHDGDTEAYAAAHLTNDERLALIERLTTPAERAERERREAARLASLSLVQQIAGADDEDRNWLDDIEQYLR